MCGHAAHETRGSALLHSRPGDRLHGRRRPRRPLTPPIRLVPQQNWGAARRSSVRHQRHPDRAVHHGAGPVGRDRAAARRRTSRSSGFRPPAPGSASLFVNPGGPGRLGGGQPSPAWARRWPAPRSPSISTWSASTRAASATPPRSCGAAPTPSSTPGGASRWPTTARPASRTSRRSTSSSSTAASQRMGAAFLAGVGTASTRPRHGHRPPGRSATTRSTILGFSYGTEIGTAYVEQFGDHVRAMVLDGAIDPSVGPVEKNIRQMAGFQTAFNDYAADCAQSADCPLGQDPGAVGRPLPPAGRPAGGHTRPDLGSARPELRRRHHRHGQRALHPAVLEVPDQRPARVAARHRRR